MSGIQLTLWLLDLKTALHLTNQEVPAAQTGEAMGTGRIVSD